MFRNYLTIAFRNMSRQKTYTLINLSGLAVGIAACILILLYVQDELSYDKYLKNHERIFRVSRSWQNANGEVNLHLGHLAPPFSPLLKLDYEGIIEYSVRLLNNSNLIAVGEKQFEEEGFFFADPEFLDVFSWKVINGDSKNALKDPYSIVITQAIATKYFGEQDPMGKTMNFNNTIELKVTAIIENVPRNSHLHPTMFAPMILVEEYYGGHEEFMSAWGSNNFSTFIKFKEGTAVRNFEANISKFIDKHLEAGEIGKASDYNKLHFMNITDVHLHSHLDSEIESNGDIAYIYLFSMIAGFNACMYIY